MMQGALIAVLLAVGFLGMAASRWSETSGQSYSDIRDRAAAEHMEVVRHAAEAYVAATTQTGDDNPFDELAAGDSVDVPVSDIADAGYLPSWYADSNPLGQQYHIAVRRDSGTSRLYGIVVTDNSAGRMASMPAEHAEMRAASMAAVSGSAGGRAMMEDGSVMLEGANETWTENPSLYGSNVTSAVKRGSLAGMLDIQGGGYHWVRDNEQCDIGDAPEYFEPGASEQAAVACPASCGATKKYVPETCIRTDWNASYTITCQNADNVVVADSFCDAGSRPSETGGVCCAGGTGGGCAGTGNLCRSPVSWEYTCYDYSGCAWNIGGWLSCNATPVWNVSAWGACSNTCGAGTESRTSWCTGEDGTQSRTVTCVDSSGNALATPTDADCLQTTSPATKPKPADNQTCTTGCDSGAEPATSQSCTDYGGCTYAWITGGWGGCGGGTGSWNPGPWGNCSVGCGPGSQARSVSCDVDANSGSQSRSVLCQRSDGTVVPDGRCDAASRPSDSQACTPASASCSGSLATTQPCSDYSGCRWTASAWSSCSASPTWSADAWGGCSASPIWQTGGWSGCSASPSWSTGSWGGCSASPSWASGGWGGCSAGSSWQVGGWGGCSANCGGGWQSRSVWCNRPWGTQYRSVWCDRPYGSQSRTVSCSRPTGSQTRSVWCDRPYGSQSRTVSCTYPTGTQTRVISCHDSTLAGNPVVNAAYCGGPGSGAGSVPTATQSCTATGSCDAGSKPATSQSCQAANCSGSGPSTSQSCTAANCSGTAPASSQTCQAGNCSGGAPSGSQSCLADDCWSGNRPASDQQCNTKTCFEHQHLETYVWILTNRPSSGYRTTSENIRGHGVSLRLYHNDKYGGYNCHIGGRNGERYSFTVRNKLNGQFPVKWGPDEDDAGCSNEDNPKGYKEYDCGDLGWQQKAYADGGAHGVSNGTRYNKYYDCRNCPAGANSNCLEP